MEHNINPFIRSAATLSLGSAVRLEASKLVNTWFLNLFFMLFCTICNQKKNKKNASYVNTCPG